MTMTSSSVVPSSSSSASTCGSSWCSQAVVARAGTVVVALVGVLLAAGGARAELTVDGITLQDTYVPWVRPLLLARRPPTFTVNRGAPHRATNPTPASKPSDISKTSAGPRWGEFFNVTHADG